MPIRVLDAETIGRIAAGEVVERPASIAKELIENSIDAGATSVTIEIRDGGIDYLRVTDNGCGIPPEEVRIAFENHATSKIVSGDGLTDILTFGFRGEALPSIAAVSKVTMTTRQRKRPSGIKVQIDGGSIMDATETGCPEGTTIVVKDLFFNTPVRRSFLKRPAAEAGAMSDIVARMILGNPGVAIRYINNGKAVYHSFGDNDLRHAALSVYGKEIAEKLVEVNESEGTLSIMGLVGIEDTARANRSQEYFFINGRTVKVPLISQLLEEAARGRIMIGQFPMCALSLRMPPNSVDINVHPSKLEVRFRNEAEIRIKVLAMLERALKGRKLLDIEKIAEPDIEVEVRPTVKPVSVEQMRMEPQNEPPKPVFEEKHDFPKTDYKEEIMPSKIPDNIPKSVDKTVDNPYKPIQTTEIPQITVPKSVKTPVDNPIDHTPKTVVDNYEIRVLGVYADTYILAEAADKLLMIDQHAAHERIIYEQLNCKLEEGTLMQELLIPQIIDVTPGEKETLMENRALLNEAGYDIDAFGERSIQVRAVPSILGKAELKPLFMEMIEQLDKLRSAAVDRRRGEIITASCKKAIKGGDPLTQAEIEALIREMLTTDAPPNCPHGRPIIKVFSKSDIEKMFKRIV